MKPNHVRYVCGVCEHRFPSAAARDRHFDRNHDPERGFLRRLLRR